MLRKNLVIGLFTIFLAGCVTTQIPVEQTGRGAGQDAPALAGSLAEPVSDASSPAENNPPAPAAGGQSAPQVDLPAVVATGTPVVAAAAPTAPAAPSGLNPLTGLMVEDAATLSLAPALVSITNFPVSARPQAGLSFSPFVFEMYIGEGMTRYLAVFYGDYPVKDNAASTSGAAGMSGSDHLALSDDRIGPVRSGRLPYESLRALYNGFLVMASASPNVKSSLGQYTNVFGNDDSDINSALVPATRLKEIAENNPKRLDQAALDVLQFDAAAPQGGRAAGSVWLPYSYLNQIFWRYDAQSGSYHRYQDNADGQTFREATDRLNGEALAYQNVVILFADHHARKETLIDIDFMYINRMPALLFRDGQVYEIYWTTANGEYEKRTGQVRPIRFIDAQGNPFALKPGQTWVEIVPSHTRYNETVDSKNYAALKAGNTPGSGNWVVHFYPPAIQD